MGQVESVIQAIKGRMGQETRVDLNSSEEVRKLDKISNSGHYATNAKDDI